ncbi:hypothetical protein HPB48_009349 [Haemaphysalis longicornis]|uniref:Uncharacterized protein n=1 Tax=Haemaphysalis longicornis TaxID=44386 RepID=A0A9J6FEP4_HAELO|nr:hypothetical protein HPB48_009349 [Haemaphysalis longicornis]
MSATQSVRCVVAATPQTQETVRRNTARSPNWTPGKAKTRTQRGSRRNVSRHTSLAAAVTHHGAVTSTRRGRHPAGVPKSKEQRHHHGPHTAAKGTQAAPSSSKPKGKALVTPGQT